MKMIKKKSAHHKKNRKSLGNVLNVLRYIPILIFGIFIGYYLLTQDTSDVVRYDKYEIFFSSERSILIAIILVLIFYVIKITSNGFLGRLYPTNLFMIMFLFLVLPGVLLTSDFSTIGMLSFYSYIASLVLFLFGLIIAKGIESKQETQRYKSDASYRVYTTKSTTYLLMLFLFTSGFVVSIVHTDFSSSVFKELASLFKSGDISGSIAVKRQVASSRDLSVIFYNYSLLMFMPLASVFIFINAVIRNNNSHKVFGLVLFIIVFLLTISGGGRLKGLSLILFIVVAYSFVKPIKLKQVINIGSVVLWFLIIQTIALGRMASSSEGQSFIHILVMSLNRVVERIFLTKGFVTQQIFYYIPEYVPYKEGETIITAILGSASTNITLAEEMFSFIYGHGFGGTAGPQAFGEAYANFGIAGMLIISFLLGLVVQISTKQVKKYIAFDAFKITFLAYLTVLIARIGYSDILTFKTNGIHILLLLFLCIVFATTMLRKLR